MPPDLQVSLAEFRFLFQFHRSLDRPWLEQGYLVDDCEDRSYCLTQSQEPVQQLQGFLDRGKSFL